MKYIHFLICFLLMNCSTEKKASNEVMNQGHSTEKAMESIRSFTKTTTIPGLQSAPKTYSFQVEIEDSKLELEKDFILYINSKALTKSDVFVVKDKHLILRFEVPKDFVWEKNAVYQLQNDTIRFDLPTPKEETIAMP